jgi:hypothetical protein
VNGQNSSITRVVSPCNRTTGSGSSSRKTGEESTDPTEEFILREVQSRLKVGITTSVPQVGCDDPEELLQDGLVIAFRMLKNARRAGKRASARTVSHYTLATLRTGRRSTGVHRNDVMNPAAQLSGHCRVQSFDEMVTTGDLSDEPLTLGEVLACKQSDPAIKAAREIDWQELIQTLDALAKEVLAALVSGTELTRLVPRLRRSRSALQRDKRRLAALIREHLGEDILLQVLQVRPQWRNNMRLI